MNRLIAAIAQIRAVDPGLRARSALRSIMVLGLVVVFLITFWVLSIAGIVLLLSRSIGMLPAVLSVGIFALLTGVALLSWLSLRKSAERRARKARVEAQRLAIEAALAVVPRNKTSGAVVALAALAAVAFWLSTSGARPDDGSEPDRN